MGTPPKATAIYARISSDQAGTALGVKRQVQDCRALAERLGWTVAEVYEDNDISAYGNKKRPAYTRMLEDLRDGLRDAVIVYHTDRLTRRPIEVEQFLDVVQTAGVRDVQFVASGGLDIANGDGLLMLRVLGAVAANESASKSRRIRRKHEERAAAGIPHRGGALRAFGYLKDGTTIVAKEADVIRVLAERFLAGESLRSLATWLDDEGVRTVADGPWNTSGLRAMLLNPRYAGLMAHRGEVIGAGIWDPIITIDQRDRIVARFEERKQTGRRTPRRYLLSGLLRCGKCGNKLFSSARTEGKDVRTRRYICVSGPDHHGCGRLTIIAEPLEELVTAAVLLRLDTPELAAVLAGKVADDDEAAALSEALGSDKARLDDLAKMYAAQQITVREWLAARGPIQDRIEDTERRIGQVTRTTMLGGLPGNGDRLTSEWPDLSLSRQNAIVAAVLDHAVIGPGLPGGKGGIDPDRVDLVWKL